MKNIITIIILACFLLASIIVIREREKYWTNQVKNWNYYVVYADNSEEKLQIKGTDIIVPRQIEGLQDIRDLEFFLKNQLNKNKLTIMSWKIIK